LVTLTSSDQPDLKKIDNKVREIAKLGADERIAFIKAVGEAAKILTDEQRKILTGFATPVSAASPMPGMSPMEHM
jgi:Spy/CpxP family protein refolding chaperone